MGKKRIYEIAKEIEQSSKAVVEKAKSLGIEVKNHMGSVDHDQANKIKAAFSTKKNDKQSGSPQPKKQAQQNSRPASQKGDASKKEIILHKQHVKIKVKENKRPIKIKQKINQHRGII